MSVYDGLRGGELTERDKAFVKAGDLLQSLDSARLLNWLAHAWANPGRYGDVTAARLASVEIRRAAALLLEVDSMLDDVIGREDRPVERGREIGVNGTIYPTMLVNYDAAARLNGTVSTDSGVAETERASLIPK